jgi:hypothetical protein
MQKDHHDCHVDRNKKEKGQGVWRLPTAFKDVQRMRQQHETGYVKDRHQQHHRDAISPVMFPQHYGFPFSREDNYWGDPLLKSRRPSSSEAIEKYGLTSMAMATFCAARRVR